MSAITSGFPSFFVQLRDILQYTQRISPAVGILVGAVLWLSIVRYFRWRQYNAIHRKYAAKWNGGLGAITPREAQEIIHVSTTYEMPRLLRIAVSFALFKTYGIPSISKLLAATKELKSADTVSRRYIDTGILIATLHLCPLTGFSDPSFELNDRGPNAKPAEDPRGAIALARTNWLHSKYNISNDDFLYTLCLFALEPIYWSDRFGWRAMSPLERHSFYVFWKEIGRRMNIKDIPDSVESMMRWSQEYESKHMVPAKSNREVAKYTLDELLIAVPEIFGIKALGERVIICLLDDVTRKAMLYEEQPWALKAAVNGTLLAIAFIQRHMRLPRFSPARAIETGPHKPAPSGKCPRLRPALFAARPWYRPEPTNFVAYCRDWFLVKINWHTEMPSSSLKSSGYRIEELGPEKWEQDGHEEVMRNAAELLGCPVTGPWSLEGRNVKGD